MSRAFSKQKLRRRACLLQAELKNLLITFLRSTRISFRSSFHYKTLLTLYPASISNLHPSLVTLVPCLDNMIGQLVRCALTLHILFYAVSALSLVKSSVNSTILSYWPCFPTSLISFIVFIAICYAFFLIFSLNRLRHLHRRGIYYSFSCPFSPVCSQDYKYFGIDTLNYLYTDSYLPEYQVAIPDVAGDLVCPVLIKKTYNSTIEHDSTCILSPMDENPYYTAAVDYFEETTDDFGAGDETCDSIASVSVSAISVAERSTNTPQRSTRKKSKGLLTSTTKSEAKWIELELERYPKVSTVIDEEDSLDNRDTDKVVSMRPNKTALGSSLQLDMAGTGAGALTKEHILVLNGKAVVVNSLANIIMTPEQAEKAIRAKNKMLRARDSQKDVCACKGNCGAHLALPKQRYLEYMMSTDELGEVVFTPYIGVGVACKHIRMPPMKVFIVGSKADNGSKRLRKTERNKRDITSRRSESRLNSAYLPHRPSTSQRPSHAKLDSSQSTPTLQPKECSENESRKPANRMDKIVPLVPSVLTTSGLKREIPPMPSTLAYTYNQSSEWSDIEEDRVHKHSTTKTDSSMEVEQSESRKFQKPILMSNESLGKHNHQSNIKKVEYDEKVSTSISVSDWDDVSE